MPRPTPERIGRALRSGTILLASASPRRSEILERAGLRFRRVSPCFDEEAVLEGLAKRPTGRSFGDALARALGELVVGKWRSLAEVPASDLVLCFDTVVHDGRRVWGKPRHRREAEAFVMDLSGRTHEVTTACLAAMGPWKAVRRYTTRVTFRRLTAKDLAGVMDRESPLDAAGAYMVQGAGLSYIESISGDYHNVVGLPLPFISWLRRGCP